jgi:hypothetical protein
VEPSRLRRCCFGAHDVTRNSSDFSRELRGEGTICHCDATNRLRATSIVNSDHIEADSTTPKYQ